MEDLRLCTGGNSLLGFRSHLIKLRAICVAHFSGKTLRRIPFKRNCSYSKMCRSQNQSDLELQDCKRVRDLCVLVGMCIVCGEGLSLDIVVL